MAPRLPPHPPLLPDRERRTRDLCDPREHLHPEGPGTADLALPVQARIVPVAERHTAYAQEICEALNAQSIRCDLDERDESVGKKIREAGMDWVPYVIVIGDDEMASKNLTVTIRRKSEPNKPHKEQLDCRYPCCLDKERDRRQTLPPALYPAQALLKGTVYLIFPPLLFPSAGIIEREGIF